MTESPALQNWIATVTEAMPHLTKPQAIGLAWWSFGMVVAQSCGLTSVAATLARLVDCKENTVRQRLREWYLDARAKKGAAHQPHQRQDLEVSQCFPALIRWVLRAWPATEHRLALAMDATTLADRFSVLAISIVYRGCAIPVAWTILPATRPGTWKPHWQALFQHLADSVPADWFVIVLADRGLYAKWLYRTIQQLNWHPYLRINTGGKYRLTPTSLFQPLSELVPQPSDTWCRAVDCFKKNPIACTLLARRDMQHTDPWLIVTDLAPAQADVAWYALRAWIESGFKDTKRGGWHWQQTHITAPDRAARHWLAIAVATLWVVSLGGEADATLPASSLAELPESHIARRRVAKQSRPRMLSCFRRGWIVLMTKLLGGLKVSLGQFYPEPWPTSSPENTDT